MKAGGIVILNGDADGNLGDRAILEATCGLLREQLGNFRIVVVSRLAELWRDRQDVVALSPGVRGLPALCRAVRQSDLVLVGGGGLFQDDDSLVKMPYWAVRVALARVLNRRVVGYALGVGPLTHRVSRVFARLAFACMDVISVRDDAAREVAQPLTDKRVRVVPDPALALVPSLAIRAREALGAAGVPLDGRPLVGVAPRRWFPPRARLVPHRFARRVGLPDPQDSPEGRQLVRLLAQVLDRIVQRHDAHVVFMPSYRVKREGDDRLAAAVAEAMRTRESSTLVTLDEPALYKACCGLLTVLIGGRMHPAILAAAMGTPVIGLAYNPKFGGLFQLLGMPDSCLDVEHFVRSGCAERVMDLVDAGMRGQRLGSEPVASLIRRIYGFHEELADQLA